ncbi:hypothetical protein [Streptomyces sp. NPDC055105]|uniref:hypothetical protein n=1 Tax=Streptomyces sp. NPDC055105 TaxID=3365719 RepID=UPI0037D263FD
MSLQRCDDHANPPAVISVLVHQQDLDALPDQTPGLIPSGRPALKMLSKRDRTVWWRTWMGCKVIATLKEGFATALNMRGAQAGFPHLSPPRSPRRVRRGLRGRTVTVSR